MGQRERAPEIVRAHEFLIRTSATVEEILSVLDSAAAAASGPLRGSLTCAQRRLRPDGFDTAWCLRSPGNLLKIMSLTISGLSREGVTDVQLRIHRYLYRTWGLFTGPTLNGGNRIERFRELVLGQLPHAA